MVSQYYRYYHCYILYMIISHAPVNFVSLGHWFMVGVLVYRRLFLLFFILLAYILKNGAEDLFYL